ncbi:MAG TPA: DNA-formamidopyrimidine glycosylase family protein [Acidimicrobiales bacterium]|jgi:formamidopyrimidine-DNA glycosylase|nr:DNA-formamidopyrimidine glycosylase family protein [Acidimicrobiales bacterium]
MPELPEVEAYRRLAERALDRRIKAVDAPDAWYLKRGADAETLNAALRGRRFTAARRIGKLLLLDTDAAPTLGLRFGMTGRLLVDGAAGVDKLLYSSVQELERFDRFAVRFHGGGELRMRDPRRLGGVELDPDESRLGPDALGLGPAALRQALAGSEAPLKARLMDQARVAGVGNLIADETLWRAGLDPARPAKSLTPAEGRRLHTHLAATLADLMGRGGSHTGDFMGARVRGGSCPRDGAPLARATVGGRTTYWCPRHQH